jgi:hypothetical protein
MPMRRRVSLGLALLAVAWSAAAFAAPLAPKGPLNTMTDIRQALRGCWQWPPLGISHAGVELTVRMSFTRSGEIIGARVTYQTPGLTDGERTLYYRAALASLSRCSPLPLSASLGEAIAGRLMAFHIHDTRQQRKA